MIRSIRYARVIAAFIGFAHVTGVSVVEAQVEESAFQAVQLDPSARHAALAGMNPVLSGRGAGSLYVNPALLTESDHGSVDVSYLNHVSDLSAGWASHARHVDGFGIVAGGIRYMSYGDIERADESGNRLGSFSASDVAMTAGLSRRAGNHVRYGGALSYLRSSIDAEAASALVLDAGVVYRADSSRMTFAASVHNLGATISSIGARSDALPFDVRLGVSRKLEHLPLLLSIGAYRLDDLDGGPDDASTLENMLYHANLGAEFQFSDSFQIRFGYSQRRHDELKIKTRLDL
ncbi:MAG: PorV/PorQ family protein, partial [Rhodothermales bacterium]|nr:PorV/PorQ family protein [Rhodothermales bacterium]